MRDLDRMNMETLSDANAGNLLSIAKLLHVGDAPLLARFLRERLSE
jgi:digeranylgeranylglycerophospholipid reductase